MSNLFGNSRLLSTTAQMHGSHDISSLHNEIDVYSKAEVDSIVASSNGPVLQNINLLPPPGTESLVTVNPNQTVTTTPVSSYGKQLLNETSFAAFRTSILEGTEEAIKYTGDSVNEILFHTNTGGTANASNLRLKITDTTMSLENDLIINCNDVNVNPNKSFTASYVGSAVGQNLNLRYGNSVYQEFDSNGININQNVVFAQNKHLKQKIEDSGSRVLVESVAKLQYCLYSYEANGNSGLTVQANGDVIELNNFKNNIGYQPISINRSLGGYLVVGDGLNNSGISANFIANGTSVFTNGASPLLHVSPTNIQPYKNIIPSGSLDIGSAVAPFNNLYNNINTITNEIRLNTFVPVLGDFRKKGIFFREGFNSSSNGDNLCIRSIGRYDPTAVPPGNVGDRLMVSAYGGLSINYQTNNALNEGSDGRIVLFHDEITIHKNMVPHQDGAVSLGTSTLKYNEIYGNNIRAHTSLYTNSVRPYSGSAIHFHTTSLTFDANQTILVDRIYSSANNRDLYLGSGPSDIKMRFTAGTGGETQTYSSIVPPNADGLLNLGSSSRYFGNLYATSVYSSTVTSNDLEANVSIIARGNGSYAEIADDNDLNGKVQIISENSSTYTGYVSFLKNDTRQLFLGYDNALQFENGSNFTIRSDAQTYLSFIHDANFANRKININVDLIPSANSYDLGSFTNRFAQIHGTTINASTQISTNLISPYAGGSETSVKINGNLLPEDPLGAPGSRSLGDDTHLWKQLYATTNVIDTSDRNTKKDITPIQDGLSIVRKLTPVSYIRKAGKRLHTGFIAQDVYEISPWKDLWAAYCDMGDLKGLRYSEFISVNTQAIKELDNENALLKQRVLRLEKMLEKLILS